jgi:hypothetical protein
MKTKITSSLLIFIASCNLSNAQQEAWVDLGGHFPDTVNTQCLSDICCIGDTCWITSCMPVDHVLYYSTDGCQTFTVVTLPDEPNAIRFLNYNLGYMATQGGRVYKSTDGGFTWTIHGIAGSPLYDMEFPPNSTSGWACGYWGHMHKVTPDGVSANVTDIFGTVNLCSLSFPDSAHGCVCGESIIMPYMNQSWGGTGSYASGGKNAVFFLNDHVGWVVGDWDTLGSGRYITTGILHTLDGENFVEQYNPARTGMYAVMFLNENEGWAGSAAGDVLHTTDGGDHWIIDQDATRPGKFIRQIFYVRESRSLYILGNKGMLMKKSKVSSINSLIKPEQVLSLFPNPCNDIMTVQFNCDKPVHQTITISNILGLKMMTFTMSAMKQELDISKLPDGIYCVNAECHETRYSAKFIVMKLSR